MNGAIRDVGATLEGTYADKSALFGAFETGKLAAALETARDDATGLEPPEELQADHEAFLAAIDEAATLGGQVTDAIQDRDIVELAIAVAELKTLHGRITQQVSPELCEAVSPDLEDGSVDAIGEDLCTPVEEVGQSDWAQGTARNARRYFIEVVPRMSGLEPSFTGEDTIEYLSAIQPEVERIMTDRADAQSALEPPEAFVEDHEALVTFFADLGSLAGRISAAAENGDEAALEELFAESGEMVNAAAESLSPETRKIISPMFRDV